MKVQLKRYPNGGFWPDTEHDESLLEHVKTGGVISGDFRQPRNPAFHRKAFALLHAMFENQEDFEQFERFYDWVKVKAGLVDLVEMSDTGPIYKLKSLSFASMGDEEFAEVYQQLITVGFQDLGMEWVIERYA